MGWGSFGRVHCAIRAEMRKKEKSCWFYSSSWSFCTIKLIVLNYSSCKVKPVLIPTSLSQLPVEPDWSLKIHLISFKYFSLLYTRRRQKTACLCKCFQRPVGELARISISSPQVSHKLAEKSITILAQGSSFVLIFR